MQNNPSHHTQLIALKRINGQISGIQKMINENRYCVDILIQLNSVIGAVEKVQDGILEVHMGHCVKDSLINKSETEKQKKIREILQLFKKFR